MTQNGNGNRSTSSAEFAGKVFVVTGGSRGIGKAIVFAAAARGAYVAFCARNSDAAAQVAEEAAQRTGSGHVVAAAADVSSEGDVEMFFDRALQAFGRIDVVVNNAGLLACGPATRHDSLMLQVPLSEWNAILSTNLTSAFLVSRRAVRQFLAQGSGGSIVSIGSVAQDGGTGMASYAVSKAGLLGLTNAIAHEYDDRGIRTHVIVAGFLDTDLMNQMSDRQLETLFYWSPQKRAGRVEEIASTTLFLASSRCGLENGTPIFVSGGARDIPAYLAQGK